MNQQVLTYVIIIVVIVAMMGFRVYRMTRERRWAVNQMWIAPVILLVVTAGIVYLDSRSTPLAGLLAPLGLIAGIAIGLYQGTHTTVRVDKPNKSLYVKVSPIGTLIFIGVLALRLGVRYATGGMAVVQAAQSQVQPAIPTLPPVAAISGSVLLAVAAGSVLGLRIYLQRIYNQAGPAQVDQGRPLQ